MQFYKIIGELIDTNDVANENDTMPSRLLVRKISNKTGEFNSTLKDGFCFLSSMGEGLVTICIIATRCINLVDLAENYIRFASIKATLSAPDEITLSNMLYLLNSANRLGFIDNDEEVLGRFGLKPLARHTRGIEFGENLVNVMAQENELFDDARRLYATQTLVPELERIYAGRKSYNAPGHPVHYIIETDDRDTRRKLYKILLDALHANLRFENTRYCYLDFSPCTDYSHTSFEALYKVSEGGVVVVRYIADSDTDEDSTAFGELDIIENICAMAKRYRNKVLTIICVPRDCKRIKAQFYENLGSMSFVEVREDFLSYTEAKAFLKSLAKENRIRTDKRLFANVKEDGTYISTELTAMFDEWYNIKLKCTVYPQYKDIAVANKEVVRAKPRGSAFDELGEMIGLTEAKSVISKAINYYKMQRLYEERGVKRNNPAMHMAFLGNPGTAKTTVARLFARIMKENGLLSRGQLVEVGRGDLVGKYVGWTAHTVRTKFKEAMGGVIFIDEAYSLVDDRSGSFGDEAINTIVQEMENRRDDVVVIFAGYPDKMEEFLQKNPGLRSRIAFHVPFADYDSEELCRIASMMSKKNGMHIDTEALKKLEEAFDVARGEKDFGNGRYVRNIFEQARMNQASRLLGKDFDDISSDEITTITADDIVIPTSKSPRKRQIGFC